MQSRPPRGGLSFGGNGKPQTPFGKGRLQTEAKKLNDYVENGKIVSGSTASAGLFAGAVGRGRLRYLRFDTLAEAVWHAQEKLSELERRGALIESGEVRNTGDEIAALYEAVGYPLQRVR